MATQGKNPPLTPRQEPVAVSQTSDTPAVDALTSSLRLDPTQASALLATAPTRAVVSVLVARALKGSRTMLMSPKALVLAMIFLPLVALLLAYLLGTPTCNDGICGAAKESLAALCGMATSNTTSPTATNIWVESIMMLQSTTATSALLAPNGSVLLRVVQRRTNTSD